jgi:ribosomal protein S13
MTPILRFLQSLRSLQKSGVIKSVDEAYDFAKREFGEINDLFKRQIEQVFKTGKPAPKPGEGGITSIKNAPKKQEPGIVDQIEASGKRLEGAANRMSEIQKEIDAMYKPKPDTSPLMNRLEEGIETLKQMKQPGMDLATGLTRTAARKILDKAGIQVPDKVDAIEVFVKEFGGESLIDVKNVAEEMIELERMGRSTKSMDEILEQSGLFDITRNPNARKGMSDEQLEQIKKEVDQDKMIKDFDPTDREPNSMGGINRTNFATGTKLIMAIINAIKKLKPMDAMKEMNEVVAKRGKYKNLDDDEVKQIFDETNDHIFERDVPADEFAVNFDDDIDISQGMIDLDEMNFTKNAQAAKKAIDNASIDTDLLKAKLMEPGSKPIKQGDPITSENFGESQFAPDTSDLEKAKKLAPKMVERFELKMKYPGIDEDFLTKIINDPDPQRKAEVLAVLDQSMLLVREGKSGDEIVDILKKETKDRKPNARGGLNYLMGM